MLKTVFALPLVCLFLSLTQAADTVPAKPKYGPLAIPLSQDSRFFQKGNSGPHFWTLSAYYVPQQDATSCSIASMAMVLNAFRSSKRLDAEDKLIAQGELKKKLKLNLSNGLTLQQLSQALNRALEMYGYDGALVGYQNFDAASEVQVRLFRSALKSLNHTTREHILINYDQGVVTGDQQAGHIAPLGAYDETTDRALIMDPDREWYEPYWAPVETIMKAMSTQDSVSKRNRGYVTVQIK